MPILGNTTALITAALLATTSAVFFGVQRLPPLTQADAETFPEFHPFRLRNGIRKVATDPMAFCKAQLSGVNCGCFNATARQLLNSRNPRANGWKYADDWDLVRTQAADVCG